MSYYWVLKGTCLYKTFVLSSGCNSETCPVAWGYNHYIGCSCNLSLPPMHWPGRVANIGEGQGTLITWMTLDGCEVDIRMMMPNYTWLCEHLRVCLAAECLMRKFNVLLNVDPTSPSFTSCPPDVIHVVSVSTPFHFSPLFHFHILLWTQTAE